MSNKENDRIGRANMILEQERKAIAEIVAGMKVGETKWFMPTNRLGYIMQTLGMRHTQDVNVWKKEL